MTYTNWQEIKEKLKALPDHWILVQETPSPNTANTNESEIRNRYKFGKDFPVRARVQFNESTGKWEVWAKHVPFFEAASDSS